MASYTSIKSGDFNDPFTWTVGGTAWPSVAGDTFNVSAGHNVRINSVFTHELGASTVNGTLYVDHLVNTEIRFGAVNLQVNTTGALKLCGLNNEPVSSSCTCLVGFNSNSDTGQGISMNSNTASFVTSGANDYVGNPRAVMKTTWSSGQSFTISGDYTQGANIWRVGQKIAVHRYPNGYSSQTTDVRLLTIASLTLSGSDTIVTISEAFPTTMNAGGYVVNLSRNVKIFKVGYNEGGGQYNTARFRIDGNSGYDPTLQLNNTEIIGCYGISTIRTKTNGKNYAYNCVLRQGAYITSGIATGVMNFTFNWCYFYTMASGLSGSFIYLNDCMSFSMASFISYSSNLILRRHIGYAHNNCTSQASNSKFYDCEFFNVNYVMYLGTGNEYYRCWFGFNKGIAANNNTDGFFGFGLGFDCEHTMYNCRFRYSYLNLSQINFDIGNAGNNSSFATVNHNDTIDTHIRYEMFGEILKNTATSAIKQPSLTSAEVIPYSFCTQQVGIPILEWEEYNVPTTPQTRTISMKSTGWSSLPTSADLYIEAVSISSDAYTRVSTFSTAAISSNDVWTNITVNFTPLYKGDVIYKVYLKNYNAASKIFVDEFLQRPGFNPKRASWSDARLKLQFDHNDWQNPESWS